MNDLAAFDLNQLQAPNNRWEILQENMEVTPANQSKVPPARTNHSMVAYNDKMYLFGGTNGFRWFNDVWCYDPAVNKWSQLDCIGYIPVPREGHSAALVDDVMYIFGGRTEEGSDLGDLAAFRITSKRWYTFQNMGPSPSPRSGHRMTAVGKSIVVVGGEPSTATAAVNDLTVVYVLDTTKIRYPADNGAQSKTQAGRKISSDGTSGRPPPSRDGSNAPDQKRIVGEPGSPTSKGPNGVIPNGPIGAPPTSKLPRVSAAAAPPPSGPPPQGQPPKPNANQPTTNGRARNASIERLEKESSIGGPGSPNLSAQSGSPVIQQESGLNGRRTKPDIPTGDTSKVKTSRQSRGQGSIDSTADTTTKTASVRPASPPPPTRQTSNPLARKGSGRNSQTVALLKELDSSRNRNAWYASELDLARKAGYVPSAPLSPALEGRGTENLDEDDKTLIEAFLAMRQQLAAVQSSIDEKSALAGRKIAEAEHQRNAAIQEAVYARAKLAAHTGSVSGTPQLDGERDVDASDRAEENSRKLAVALGSQKELQAQVARLTSELGSEKRARQLADDTSNAAQKRLADLETFKQQKSLELESLRAELHQAQKEGRDHAMTGAEAAAALKMLQLERDDLHAKVRDVPGSDGSQPTSLASLQAALVASTEVRSHLEQKLEEERAAREKVESKLTKLKAEHETHTAELVAVSQRLRDAEELADRHAAEANTHRQALLSGLDKITASGSKEKQADAERIVALQGQVNAANNLVRKYQEEADTASDRLRSAEERIAGLEAYQEQSSREGVTIRRQLQQAMKDAQTHQAASAELKHKHANQQLETNAMAVQLNTLKDILTERGISPTSVSRTRALSGNPDSPGANFEQQLAESKTALEEFKQQTELQAQEAEAAYRDRVSQLENDYQSAVHYVKGTEKMLKRMKEELAKYKTENSRLKAENIDLEDRAASPRAGAVSAPTDWESQRSVLEAKVHELQEQSRSTSGLLEKQLGEIRKELDAAKQERDVARKTSVETGQRLTLQEQRLETVQHENALLEKRAQDAEHKVGLLLNQVESSVDNYRRRSRQVLPETPASAVIANGLGHQRQESSEAESVYGGMSESRNSAALDNLANELDMLRSKWEATNESYRLSNAFEFEGATGKKAGDDDGGASIGLSESLADWRKRLDSEEQQVVRK
jgi:hypothetical protein